MPEARATSMPGEAITHVDRPLALAMRGITRRFAGTLALDDADFTLRPGTIHALLGENGAGKSTLMRAAYGLLRPDAGTITIEGDRARLASPADAIARGLGMVQQHFALVGAMTVAENVALGGRGRFSAAAVADRVREIGHRTGLALDPAARIATLGVGAQQRVEIVKALAHDARILILDEPTAVLAPAEAADLLRWLRTFSSTGGSVVLITHRLREALGAADDVTVLRRGRTVLTAPAGAVGEHELATAMLGDAAWASPAPSLSAATTRATAAQNSASSVMVAHSTSLTVANDSGILRLRDVTLELRAGQIVGIAAVEGAGQHELLRLFAARALPLGTTITGTITLPASIGFVPEDRHGDAVLLDFPLHENVALRDARDRRGRVDWRHERVRTSTLLAEHDVRASEPAAPMRTLSGGNQQKLVLARELDGAPALLVVENPTRGLDIRATAAVHARLRAARAAGAAVLFHSSDLDEVLALADRVIVLFAGSATELPAGDRERVGAAMLGLA